MKIKDKLESLIKDKILLDIDDYIDELLEAIASKKDDSSTKEELQNMQEMKQEFKVLLEELANNTLSDEECEEILEEINEIRNFDLDEN